VDQILLKVALTGSLTAMGLRQIMLTVHKELINV
jgi:hypothetical protein